MQREDTAMITISAAQAAAHGLPAVGVSVDPTGTPMMVSPLAQADLYLVASGPPGGRLLFQVWTSDETGRDEAAVQRAVAARYTKPALTPTTWGTPGTLTLAGAARPAVSYLSDKAMFLTGWCAALVPHARGQLLVVLGRGSPGATAVSCDEVASHPSLAPLVRTFAVVEG
jgi:hypothetical protein